MANRLELDYRLRLSNHHLSNIYDTGFYIEAGNLDTQKITKLINGEELSFYEVINQDIARLSPSKVTEESYDEVLQMLYFHNKKSVDTSEKIFLTCGVLKWKSSKDNEIYAPIVLIPIRVNFDSNDHITVKRVGKIVDNKYLVEEIKRRMGIDIPHYDRPDSIFDIDYYGDNIAKLTNSTFELGNFITYARVDYVDIELNRNKFSPQRSYMNYDNNEIHLYPPIHLNMITKANKEQKDALIVASEGKNFAIDGKLGTGKTLTAINIIANMLNKDKKVLYLSNDLNSIKKVKQIFETLNLGKYIFDFDHPLQDYIEDNLVAPEGNITELQKKLTNQIMAITEFQKTLSTRINGYRYHEIHKNIIHLSREEKADVKFLKSVSLHRHEIEILEESFRNIEEGLSHFETFKESKWHCLHDNLKTIDEGKILQVLENFKETQIEGEELSRILENEFHFNKIPDIRIIRRLIYNQNSLKNQQPAPSWTEKNLDAFKDAMKNVEELNQKIMQYYLVSEEIAEKYDYRITSFNMLEIIASLYGEYFKEIDTPKVNHLLNSKKQVLRMALSIENHKNNFNRLKGQLNNHFKTRKVELGALEELKGLIDFLKENSFDKKWLNFNGAEKNTYVKKLKFYEEFFNNHTQALAFINGSLIKNDSELISQVLEPSEKKIKGKQADNKGELKRLKKYVKSSVLKNSNFNITKFIQKVKKYVETDNDYAKNVIGYQEMFGSKPEVIDGLSDVLVNFFLYIEKTKNLKEFPVKSYLQYYSSLSKAEQINAIKDLISIISIQTDIEKLVEELKPYGFRVRSFHFESRLNEISLISSYLKKVYRTNDYIKSLFLKPQEMITVDDYVYIKNILEEKQCVLTFLEENEKRYRFLYGAYYRGLNTEVSTIKLAIEKYNNFIKMIENESKVIDLYKEDQYKQFIFLFEKASNFYENWMKCFREYSKYFKENIIAYIDNPFYENEENIIKQLKESDQLKYHLLILEHCRVLNDNKLGYVTKNIFAGLLKSNIRRGFLYSYFLNIKEDFKLRYPDVKNSEEIVQLLASSNDLTTQIIGENIYKLQKKLNYDRERLQSRLKKIKSNNFNQMVKETLPYKGLYLADSDILLSGLDISNFDCLIVDDAHLASSNKYNRVVEANQLIILGDKDAKSSIANNLISRIRLGNTITLNFCYHPNNKILLDYRKEKDNIKGIIDDFTSKDSGIKYINEEKSLGTYVMNVFEENKESTINVFIGSDQSHFEVYKSIVNQLVTKKYSKEQILEILKNQIRITDAKVSYLEWADYNVFYYNDFIELEEVAFEIILASIMIVRKQLIIYHKKIADKEQPLRKSVETLIKYEEKYQKFKEVNDTDTIRHPLSVELKKQGLMVYQGFGNLDLIVKKRQKVSGIIIYSETQKIDADLIEDYENYLKTYREYGISIQMVFSKDLCDGFDAEIKKITSRCEG